MQSINYGSNKSQEGGTSPTFVANRTALLKLKEITSNDP